MPTGTRPTSARVREALFSIWGEEFGGRRFADLFAGSGVVGLEAASRGAGRVLLVDALPEAVSMQRRAILELGLGDRVETCRLRLPSAVEGVAGRGGARDGAPGGSGPLDRGAPYDFVFADPPYAFDAFAELLESLVSRLSGDGEVVLEHSTRVVTPDAVEGLRQVDRRIYGDSALSFYRSRNASSSR